MGKFEDLLNQGNSSTEEDKKKKTFEDLINQGSEDRKREDVRKVDTDYINSFIDSSNRFFETVGEDYEGIGWDNASSIYNKHQATLDYLYRQRDIIESWMGENRDALDADTYASLVSIFDNFRQGSERLHHHIRR